MHQLQLDKQFPFWEPYYVRVISRRAIRDFVERHPESASSLQHWANATESADWQSTVGVRNTFNSADFVGEFTVFNVGGNKYRIIAFIHYRQGAVYIKYILTHKEYSKGDWKQ